MTFSRALAGVAAAAALVAAPARASAPPSFFGVNWDGPATEGEDADQRLEWERMRLAGVQSVRVVFDWNQIEPSQGNFDFRTSDVLVARAVGQGLTLLPVILYSPEWARKYPGRHGSPPRAPDLPARFLSKLVERYGPQGSFWAENPSQQPKPIRHWQMWNEPELSEYWNEKSFWKGYAKVVRASHRALRRADGGARLILAGSVGFSWESLDRLYRQGIRGYFDAVAIHPYTGSVKNLLKVVRLNRRVLTRWKDTKRPVWITEMCWPASKGRVREPRGLREVVTDDHGMASRLEDAYRTLLRTRRSTTEGVSRAYWYTWSSSYSGQSDVFRYAGLLRYSGGTVSPTKAFYAYRRAAKAAG